MESITLHMINFRCFSDCTVALKPNMLLDGPSGSGKTTILKALLFAFSGDGRQCIKFGEKTCSVTATFTIFEDTYIVRRSVRPNRLCFCVQGGPWSEDAVAQEQMNSLLSANYFHLAYVGQNTSSFLSMSPKDRFETIRSVLIDHRKIELLKKNLKLLRDIRQRRYDVLGGKMAAFVHIDNETGGSNEPRESVVSLREKISALQEKIEEGEKNNRFRAYLREKLTTLSSRPINEVKAELDHIQHFLPFLKTWTHLGRVPIPTIILAQKANTARELSSLAERIARSGTPADCPSCRTRLVIRGKGLFLPTCEIVAPEESRLSERYAECQTKLDRLNRQLEEIDTGGEETAADSTLPAADAAALHESMHAGMPDPEILKLSVAEAYERVERLQAELIETQERACLNTLVVPEYRDLAVERRDLAALQTSLENAVFHQNKRLQLLQKGAKIELKLAAEALARCTALTCLVSEAETHVMNTNLCAINNLLNAIVEEMTRGQLQIMLRLDNKLGHQKLNIVIVNRGQQTDHSTLSGGETARVNMALAIVFTIARGIPFLIFDEATSSLDEETATAVVKLIQRVYPGMFICVAHQAVKGVFTHVIDVDDLKVPQNIR